MASSTSGSKTPDHSPPAHAVLRLARVEPAAEQGVMLVYADDAGREYVWLLEQSSLQEFFALLLGGRMHPGRRVVIDRVDITVEPPHPSLSEPMLCLGLGPLETCTPLDRPALTGLRDEIDALLRSRP